MKFSTTLVFVALCALVVGIYLKTNPSVSEIPMPKLESLSITSDLMNVPASDRVVWFQLQNRLEKTVFTLTLENDQWMLRHPIKDDANNQLVEIFIQKLLATNRMDNFLPEKNWDAYGLKRPNFKIGIATEGESKRRYLYLGDKSPVGDLIFAKWEGEATYFLLSPEIKNIFKKSLYTLRNKRVFPISQSEIKKVLIRNDARIFQFVHEDDGWFWIDLEILQKKIKNQKAIERLTVQLNRLYIKDFLDDLSPNEDYGFPEQGFDIKVVGLDESSKALLVGKVFPRRDAYYAKIEGASQVFLIDRERMDRLFEFMLNLAGETERY